MRAVKRFVKQYIHRFRMKEVTGRLVDAKTELRDVEGKWRIFNEVLLKIAGNACGAERLRFKSIRKGT